jgi:hypothetical protein
MRRRFQGIGVLAGLLSAAGCGHKIVWSADPNQPVTYSIERQKKFVSGAFQETDRLELSFRFAANRQASIAIAGSPPANVTLAPDGSVSPVDAEIPLIATLLALSSPEGGGRQQVGAKWTVRNPRDAALRDDELELQLEHTVEFRGVSQSGGNNILELRIAGARRVVDNGQIRRLLGLPSADPAKAAVTTALAVLSRWTPYLDGTVWWNEGLGAPERADLRLVAAPIPVPNAAAISSSTGQNRLVVTRKP